MVSRYRTGHEPVPGYRLSEFLGSGAFGEVWKSVGPGGVETAVKIIDLSRKQGTKEFRALGLVKRIHHPNLVPITAFWLKDGNGNILDAESQEAQPINTRATVDVDSASSEIRPAELIISMGLGEMNLFDRLEQCQAEGLPAIPIEELLDYMDGAARAIDYLNSPRHDLGKGRIAIQHCDIKPQNIMIVGGGAQVCDFGLARALEDIRMSSAAGSPAYGAPELLRGDKPSATTDQYSLAISYVELRTGELPFDDDSLMGVVNAHLQGNLNLSRLSETERRVVERATALKPEDRWPSTVKMVKALREAAEGRQQDITDSGEISSGTEILPGYQLVDRLDRSGSEEVWQATASGGEPVALLIRDLTKFGETLDLEALKLICAQVEHPSLSKPYEYHLLDKHWQKVAPDEIGDGDAASLGKLIVVGHLYSSNLQMRLEQSRRRSDGRRGIPVPELLVYMAQAADAIDYMNAPTHQWGPRRISLVHCNVRPVNLLLDRGSIKVGNFAQTKIIESETVAFPNAAMGLEPAYCAPEMLEGKLSRRSDQYALAVSYVQLRTDELPFESLSSSSRRLSALQQEEVDLSQLEDAEAEVVRRALSFAPADRFDSCRDFVEELASAFGEVVPEPLGSAPAELPPVRSTPTRARTATATMVDDSISHRDTVGDDVLETRGSDSLLAGTITAAGKKIPVKALAVAGGIAAALLIVFLLVSSNNSQTDGQLALIAVQGEVETFLGNRDFPSALSTIGQAPQGITPEALSTLRQRVRNEWLRQFETHLNAGEYQPAATTAINMLQSFTGDPELREDFRSSFQKTAEGALAKRDFDKAGAIVRSLDDEKVQVALLTSSAPLRDELLSTWREQTKEEIRQGQYAAAVESMNELVNHAPEKEVRAEVLSAWREKVREQYENEDYDLVLASTAELLKTFPEDKDALLDQRNAQRAKDNKDFGARMKQFRTLMDTGREQLDETPDLAAKSFADAAKLMSEDDDRLQRQQARLEHARAVARTEKPDWDAFRTELTELQQLGVLQAHDAAQVLALEALAVAGEGGSTDEVTAALIKLKQPEDRLVFLEAWERKSIDTLANRVFDDLRMQALQAETAAAGLKMLEPLFQYRRQDFESLLVKAELQIQADQPKAATETLDEVIAVAPDDTSKAEAQRDAATAAQFYIFADRTQVPAARRKALTQLQEQLLKLERTSMAKQFCLAIVRVGESTPELFVDSISALGNVLDKLPAGADKDQLVSSSLTGLESRLAEQYVQGEFGPAQSTVAAAEKFAVDDAAKMRFQSSAEALVPLATAFNPQEQLEKRLADLATAAALLKNVSDPRLLQAAATRAAATAQKQPPFVIPAITLLGEVQGRLKESDGQPQVARLFHELRGRHNLNLVTDTKLPTAQRQAAYTELADDVTFASPEEAEQWALEAVQSFDPEKEPTLVAAAEQTLSAASKLATTEQARARLANRILGLGIYAELAAVRDVERPTESRLEALTKLSEQVPQLPPADAQEIALQLKSLAIATPALLPGVTQTVKAAFETTKAPALEMAWRELLARAALQTADDSDQTADARTKALEQFQTEVAQLPEMQRLALLQDALTSTADGVPTLAEVEPLCTALADSFNSRENQQALEKQLSGAKFQRALRQFQQVNRSVTQRRDDLEQLQEFAPAADDATRIAAATAARQAVDSQSQLSLPVVALLAETERLVEAPDLKQQARELHRGLLQSVVDAAIDNPATSPNFDEWQQICKAAIAAGVNDPAVQALLAECLAEQVLSDETQQAVLWPQARRAIDEARKRQDPPGGDAPEVPGAGNQQNVQAGNNANAANDADNNQQQDDQQQPAENAKPDRQGYLLYVAGLVARCAGEQADADEVADALTEAFATKSPALKNAHRQKRGLDQLAWAADRYRTTDLTELPGQLAKPFDADDVQLKKIAGWMKTAREIGRNNLPPEVSIDQALASAWQAKPDVAATLEITRPLSAAGFAGLGDNAIPLMLAHARALANGEKPADGYAAYRKLYETIKKNNEKLSDEAAVAVHDAVVLPALQLGTGLPHDAKPQREQLAFWHATQGKLISDHQYADWKYADPQQQATDAYQEAIDLDDQVAEYYTGMVAAALRLENPDLAKLDTNIVKGLQLDPENINAKISYGKIRSLQSRDDRIFSERTKLLNEAIEQFEGAYSLAEKFSPEEIPSCLINLSTAHVELANYSQEEQAKLLHKAEDYALKATKIDGQQYPEYAYEVLGNATEDLAWLAKEEEKWEESYKAFSRAIELRPIIPKYYVNRARLNYKRVTSGGQVKENGDYLEDALTDLDQAARRDPNTRELEYWRGRIKLYQARQAKDKAQQAKLLADAVAAFDKTLQVKNVWPEAYAQRARAAVAMNDLATMNKSYQKAIELTAKSPLEKTNYLFRWLQDSYSLAAVQKSPAALALVHERADELRQMDEGLGFDPKQQAGLYEGHIYLLEGKLPEADKAFADTVPEDLAQTTASDVVALVNRIEIAYKAPADFLSRPAALDRIQKFGERTADLMAQDPKSDPNLEVRARSITSYAELELASTSPNSNAVRTEAAANLERCIELDPDHAFSWYWKQMLVKQWQFLHPQPLPGMKDRALTLLDEAAKDKNAPPDKSAAIKREREDLKRVWN